MLTGSINIDVDILQENWRLIRVEISVILDSDSDFIIGLIVARILKKSTCRTVDNSKTIQYKAMECNAVQCQTNSSDWQQGGV